MKHWYQRPPESLSEYVRTVLIVEGFSLPDPQAKPLFTNGIPTLYCRTGKTQDGYGSIVQLIFYGKSTPVECWTVHENETVIAYFFHPFAMSTMFNIPMVALMKSPIELSNWNPHKTNALRTQLVYAASTDQKIAVLGHLLVQEQQLHTRECEIIKYATDEMMNNPEIKILPILLKKLNLTARTFQRIFKKYVGVAPSQYRRICQFQQSFSQVRANDFEKLADVAFDNGFADQSHFIRSFKEFTQTSPNDYLKSGLKEKNR